MKELKNVKLSENVTVDGNVWEAIVWMLDDDKLAQTHDDFAPCTDEKLLAEYLKLDPEFENVLKSEFNIEL